MIWLVIIPVVFIILIAVGVVGRLRIEEDCDGWGTIYDGIPPATMQQSDPNMEVYTLEVYARENGVRMDTVYTQDGKQWKG